MQATTDKQCAFSSGILELSDRQNVMTWMRSEKFRDGKL
jgi:hypothetical protein